MGKRFNVTGRFLINYQLIIKTLIINIYNLAAKKSLGRQMATKGKILLLKLAKGNFFLFFLTYPWKFPPGNFTLGKTAHTMTHVTFLGKSHLRKGKMVNLAKCNRETSSRFSLCCFVIHVYIFVLNKTAGFGCRHFV